MDDKTDFRDMYGDDMADKLGVPKRDYRDRPPVDEPRVIPWGRTASWVYAALAIFSLLSWYGIAVVVGLAW